MELNLVQGAALYAVLFGVLGGAVAALYGWATRGRRRSLRDERNPSAAGDDGPRRWVARGSWLAVVCSGICLFGSQPPGWVWWLAPAVFAVLALVVLPCPALLRLNDGWDQVRPLGYLACVLAAAACLLAPVACVVGLVWLGFEVPLVGFLEAGGIAGVWLAAAVALRGRWGWTSATIVIVALAVSFRLWRAGIDAPHGWLPVAGLVALPVLMLLVRFARGSSPGGTPAARATLALPVLETGLAGAGAGAAVAWVLGAYWAWPTTVAILAALAVAEMRRLRAWGRARTQRGTSPLPQGTWAIFLAQALNGLMFSSWFPYVATIAVLLDLDESELGVALVGLPIGLLIGVGASYPLMRLLGTRWSLTLGLILYCAGMALPGLAGSKEWLALALAVPAFGNGIFDPSVSAETNKFARVAGRDLQGKAGASFSSAQVLSGLLVPVAVGAGVPPVVYLGGAAVLGMALAVLACVRLLRCDPYVAPEETHRAGRRGIRWWTWALLVAILAVAGFVTEGIWADWHGVYLSGEGIGASLAIAAIGYLAFQIASVMARLGYGGLVDRFGRLPVVLAAAGVAFVGAVVIVAAVSPAMGLIGAVVLGLGTGPIAPIAQAAAGTDELAVTLVTGSGYVALAAAPALIGFLAHATSLRTALLTLIGATVVMALTALALRRRIDMSESPSAAATA